MVKIFKSFDFGEDFRNTSNLDKIVDNFNFGQNFKKERFHENFKFSHNFLKTLKNFENLKILTEIKIFELSRVLAKI